MPYVTCYLLVCNVLCLLFVTCCQTLSADAFAISCFSVINDLDFAVLMLLCFFVFFWIEGGLQHGRHLEELADYYNMYFELMEYWREVLGDRFIEVDYEDTVNDTEAQARKMIDYIDLPWNEACLEPHKQKRAILTASKTQVVKPVYKTSVRSWERYADQLKPLIERLESGPAKHLLDI